MPNTAEILERLESSGTEIAPIEPDSEENAPAVETEGAEDAKDAKEGEAAEADKKPDDKKAPNADRVAAQFAALAREKQQARAIQQTIEQHATQLKAQEAALKSEAEKLKTAFESPENIFTILHDKFGLRTLDDLKKYAEKTWKAPEPAVADEDRPMTRREYEAAKAKDAEERRVEAARNETYAQFDALVEKHDAASILYSTEEARKLGDKIADEWIAAGIAWTLPDIAEELEKRARLDKRYAKVKKPGSEPAPKVASEASQQGSKANGAKTAEPPPEETRKERLKRLEALIK